MSTPSMPAMESSSGLVICDSITSDDAPTSRVLTVTTGSSMRGYSRTVSWLYETMPTSTISSDITHASTGRRIVSSEMRMMACSYAGAPMRGADAAPDAAPAGRRTACGLSMSITRSGSASPRITRA
jgi:hypothetical protein